MSDYDTFVSLLTHGFALNVVEGRNIHAVPSLKSGVDEHGGIGEDVLVIFDVEEVKRRLAPANAVEDTNVDVLPEDGRYELEVFFSFDHADVLLVVKLLGHSLEVRPLGVEDLPSSHDLS